MADNRQSSGKNAVRNAKAASKIRAAQQQKRQRVQWSIGVIALVVVGVLVLVLAKQSRPSAAERNGTAVTTAPASIATNLAKVPLESISASYAARLKAYTAQPTSDPTFVPKPLTGKALTSAGKPEVLYMGAEYCPYCAAERWAMTVALSKFGTFSGLKVLKSSESSVPTLSYLSAKFTSKYLTFTPIELQDQNHKDLEKATTAQMKMLTTLGGGSYPFINFGGKFLQSSASVDTSVLIGQKQVDIASALANSKATGVVVKSLPGQVNSVAGGFIKAICTLTKGQPGNVCKAIPAG